MNSTAQKRKCWMIVAGLFALGAAIVLASALPRIVSRASQRKAAMSLEQQRYSFLREFLLAAYPDLPVKQSLWTVSERTPLDSLPTPCGTCIVSIEGPMIPHDFAGKIIPNVGFTEGDLLSAVFVVDPGGELDQVNIMGMWANSRANDKLEKTCESRPNCGERDVVAALEKEGGRFGPSHKSEFIAQIPAKALGKVLGVNLTVQSAEFFFEKEPGDKPDVHLGWEVRLRGHANGQAFTYGLTFEPFGGRLLGLSRKLSEILGETH